MGSILAIPLGEAGMEDKKHMSITYMESIYFIFVCLIIFSVLIFFYWQVAVLSLILGLFFTFYLQRRYQNILAQADLEIVGGLLITVFPIAVITLLLYFASSIIRSVRHRNHPRQFPALYVLLICYLIALVVFGVFALLSI
jgi:hypothetical protein